MQGFSFGFREAGWFEAAASHTLGANIAERALVNAVLAEDEQLRWTMLRPGAGRATSTPRLVEADLRTFGPESTASSVFLVNPPSFSAAHRLRGNAPVPLCGLVHSIWSHEGLSAFHSVLLHARSGDTLVCTSEAARSAVMLTLEQCRLELAHAAGRVPAELSLPSVEHIPLGVDMPNETDLAPSWARRLLRLPENAFVILALGRISSTYKADLSSLLLAASALRSLNRPVYVLVAGQSGDGRTALELKQLGEALGLGERLAIVENFPEFLKTSLYAAADVCVFPSDSVQESFGLAVLEAMAHGRAVVASDWSGFRELVDHDQTGWLLPTLTSARGADAVRLWAAREPMLASAVLAESTVVDAGALQVCLARLLGEPAWAREFGERGRKRAALYAWPVVARRFLALWRTQVELARPALNTVFSPVDVFAHYATGMLTPMHLLARIPEQPFLEPSIRLLESLGHPQPSLPLALCQATSQEPASVAELEEQGFALEDILWLAKKGLRRLVDPQVLRDPPKEQDAV